jgi:uncharacterized damage-inducible protein DinB
MDSPMLEELTLGEAREYQPPTADGKDELIRLWDEHSEALNALWPGLRPSMFQETKTVFGTYTSKVYELVWYVIDNEIHHRAQGYVYLRSLGIDPPHFWERSAPAASIATTESVYSARGR